MTWRMPRTEADQWQKIIFYKIIQKFNFLIYFPIFYLFLQQKKKYPLFLPNSKRRMFDSLLQHQRFPLEHFAFCSLSLSFVCSTGNCADQPMCHHLERNSGAQSTWTILDTLGCSSHMLALVHAISNICELSQASGVIINYWALHSIDQQFKSPSPQLCCKDSCLCRIFPLSHTGFFLSIYFCIKPYSSFWTGL